MEQTYKETVSELEFSLKFLKSELSKEVFDMQKMDMIITNIYRATNTFDNEDSELLFSHLHYRAEIILKEAFGYNDFEAISYIPDNYYPASDDALDISKWMILNYACVYGFTSELEILLNFIKENF